MTARSRLVVGNWKMNPASVTDAVRIARGVRELDAAHVEVGVAPPAIALAAVADALRGSDVRVFAQDVHWEEKGAFTGQLAAPMLAGIAVGVVVGHSEVRRDQCDDDARVGLKVARALASGLRVVLCVGESEAEFDAGDTQAVIASQVAAAVATALPPSEPLGSAAPPRAARAAEASSGHAPRTRAQAADRSAGLVVAYEPVWAIGTGRPATAAHASAAARTIRASLRAAGVDGEQTRVLYGGSVTAESVGEFAGAGGIDGALVGGASLRAEEFARIVRSFS